MKVLKINWCHEIVSITALNQVLFFPLIILFDKRHQAPSNYFLLNNRMEILIVGIEINRRELQFLSIHSKLCLGV